MSLSFPVSAGLDDLIDALREYARVLDQERGLPRNVHEASVRVFKAGAAFEAAVFDASGWGVKLFAYDDEDLDAELEDEPEEDDLQVVRHDTRLRVTIREDFVVTDEDALLAEGRAAHRESWPQDPAEAAEQNVESAVDALSTLLHRHHRDMVAIDLPIERWGLENAGGETSIDVVDIVFDEDPDWPEV